MLYHRKMAGDQKAEWIVPTTGAKTLPVIEILTGRGFITGKSGSGKSNSASVIAEALLEDNYNLLIVDPEGEYYGLKEKYEILHVGNDDLCDVQVTPNHAEQLAEIALEQNMPVILDVSDYLDGDEASELIANVVRELFQKEKDVRKPFLLMIEEMQEYLPQQGGNDELSELLERVAKRGRKRGLGMLGMSQRPSSVDKDFITQCDWMVWHRLTWKNDIDVVRNVLGSEKADMVEDLGTGEGFLMTDWDESVEKVQFKRKHTHDAGATPGLESYDRPDLKSVSQDLIRQIKSNEVSDSGSTPNEPELNPDDHAELSSAVEAVETEGDSILESDPFSAEPEPESTEQTDPTEPAAGSLQAEVAEYQPPGELDDLTEPELQQRVQSLDRRNQILEDEVTELRTVLKNTPDSATNTHQNEHSVPSEQRQQRKEHRKAKNPSRPVPPDPPVEREGVAGNIVEFVSMLLFLIQSLIYRCQLLWYRFRWGNENLDAAPTHQNR